MERTHGYIICQVGLLNIEGKVERNCYKINAVWLTLYMTDSSIGVPLNDEMQICVCQVHLFKWQ